MYPRYWIPISLVKNPSAVYLRSVEKNSIPGLSLGSLSAFLAEGDEIQHFCPLPRSTLQVGLPVALHAGRVMTEATDGILGVLSEIPSFTGLWKGCAPTRPISLAQRRNFRE
jgi:hypothetical protein